MKIAFTHNLQITNSEEEAEFDRPETVSAITEAIRDLGHEVEPIDVAGPASRVVARLEALAPSLVFNTAEGAEGRFREAFYPALFDRLGLPFTFSDAYVCTVTLDKQLTKMLVKREGVKTPAWLFIDNRSQTRLLKETSLNFPLIVKPNFEGSSMGISANCIVEDVNVLLERVEALLEKFTEGIIVEEFIVGRDITVPFLEKAAPETYGILEPAEYLFNIADSSKPGYRIYDYKMKSVHHELVDVKVPAEVTSEQKERLAKMSARVIKSLGICDAARIDYRLSEDGELYFIEVNALPSLEPGASIYASAALAGYDTLQKVIGAIIESASKRFGIDLKTIRAPKRREKVKVGLTFNIRRVNNELHNTIDDEAEYDSPETITAIREAIESYGHDVVELEATPELPSILPHAGVDVVFNVAEGFGGRARESQVPALLELLRIPYTGSDPTTMSLALDKGLAKRLIVEAGLKTPAFLTMVSGKERLPKNLRFPVIVKPIAEGSSKGIFKASVVEDEKEMRLIVQDVVEKYRQAVIVENFLPGREFTVALLGEKRPRALPPMEVVFPEKSDKYPIYSFENKFFNKNVRFDAPARIEEPLKMELETFAKDVFTVLGCRDFARIDLRLDESGNINFVECNPLPGLTPGFSDFCVTAEAAGITYRSLIGEILAPAMRRMRECQREKMLAVRL